MTTTHNQSTHSPGCPWDSGELGRSEEHVRVASDEEMKDVDDALALQMISIRLQKSLIEDLKAIAEHHGIGYQPMVRDLLNRFVRSEKRTLLLDQLSSLDDTPEEPGSKPVDDFIARIRAA